MENGSIVQIGRPDDLVLTPATEYVARFVRDVPKAKLLRAEHILEDLPSSVPSNHGPTVHLKTTMDAFAHTVIAAQSPVIIVNDAGVPVGQVRPEIVARVMAGLPHTIASPRADEAAS
ncbi:MAG: hypothetical protein AAGF56_11960 [Pseudomonadota bacterium]